jgi:tetratricopeptide (TPR) repeat protein
LAFYILYQLYHHKFLLWLIWGEVIGLASFLYDHRVYFVGYRAYSDQVESYLSIFGQFLRLGALISYTVGGALALRFLQKKFRDNQGEQVADDGGATSSASSARSFAMPRTEVMEEDTGREILRQLRKQNQLTWISIVILIAFVGIYVPFRVMRSHSRSDSARTATSWGQVTSLMDAAEYDAAMAMTEVLIEKAPDYYYGYSFLGASYLAKGDFAKAEENFAKAYELFPTEDNEKDLLAVREILNRQKTQ